jgi:hypothetical protein
MFVRHGTNWNADLRGTGSNRELESGMATKQDLRRATFTRLAGLCNKVAECPGADSETANKARELRKDLLAFSRWIGPGKTLKQVESEEEALRSRAVNFLYSEQTRWT